MYGVDPCPPLDPTPHDEGEKGQFLTSGKTGSIPSAKPPCPSCVDFSLALPPFVHCQTIL